MGLNCVYLFAGLAQPILKKTDSSLIIFKNYYYLIIITQVLIVYQRWGNISFCQYNICNNVLSHNTLFCHTKFCFSYQIEMIQYIYDVSVILKISFRAHTVIL